MPPMHDNMSAVARPRECWWLMTTKFPFSWNDHGTDDQMSWWWCCICGFFLPASPKWVSWELSKNNYLQLQRQQKSRHSLQLETILKANLQSWTVVSLSSSDRQIRDSYKLHNHCTLWFFAVALIYWWPVFSTLTKLMQFSLFLFNLLYAQK